MKSNKRTKKKRNLSRIIYVYLKYFYHGLPEKYRSGLKQEAVFAGFEGDVDDFVIKLYGVFGVMVVINALVLYTIPVTLYLKVLPLLVILVMGFFAPYIIFTMIAESRKNEIELMLPDMLFLTSSNIRSGLTIDRALLFSARPEFGALSDEIKRVAFKIYGGLPTEDALRELAGKIKSSIFERTVNLLIDGIRSGGEVAKLLEESATDIRNTHIIQKEIKASVMMYVMFILIAAVLGAPVLFAISSFMVTSTMNMWSEQATNLEDIPSVQGVNFISMGGTGVDPAIFGYFAVIAIIITTASAGLIISQIQSGNNKQGIKYAPIFVTMALGIYFLTKSIVVKTLGGMMGIT